MKRPLLELQGLSKHFAAPGGTVQAVDGVNLSVEEGETLGLVGESGCGKSTIAQMIVGLLEPTEGNVRFRDALLSDKRGAARREVRRRIQYIFQDPNDSLDPRMRVGALIGEGLKAAGVGRAERLERCRRALDQVGLPPEAIDRYPHEFSGGQRQRIGIARALVLGPELVVADEPISALDVSVQSQILNLMGELKRALGLTYVFVAHNLAAVAYVSDRIAVMYLGRIVEIGRTDEIMRNPQHPYTRALLSAIPEPEVGARRRKRIKLQGEVPNPINPPSGCRFRTRCPLAQDICALTAPELLTPGTGTTASHRVACHVPALPMDSAD